MQNWYFRYDNILCTYFSEKFLQLPERAKQNASPTSLGKRVLRLAGYTFVRLIGNLFHSVENEEQLRGKVWLYVVSQNNYDSLQFIRENMPEAVLVAGQSKAIGKYDSSVQRISLRRKVLYYYKFLPLLLKFLQKKPRQTHRFFDLLYDAIGFYEVYLHKLKQYKPACIVFANDHNPDARAMLLAAKKLHIKTVYIQHASVSAFFPPLQFDLNLLEGQDSLDKYKVCGPVTGKVALIGMPKADDYVQFRNQRQEINTIGIGCNLLDLTSEIEILVLALAMHFPHLHLVVRPHPRDKRDYLFLQQLSDKVTFSLARTESTFDYLRRIDVQISGNSGIHLEAVLLNVWSIYYNFSKQEELYDYYGFIKNGLIDSAANATSLIALLETNIKQKPAVYLKAKYYNATVGTEYDGHSSKLALKYLNSFLQD